jgi:hypothetical protein
MIIDRKSILKAPTIVVVMIFMSCDGAETVPTASSSSARSQDCGRYQIVSGYAASAITGDDRQQIAVTMRIDTRTGRTWYWVPPSELIPGGWIVAPDSAPATDAAP